MVQKIVFPRVPGWYGIKLFLVFIFLGVVSALLTVVYGNPYQAAVRLLGYFIVFATLYGTALGVQRYGITLVARWIVAGYAITGIYALFEVAAILGVAPAYSLIMLVRDVMVVPFPWSGRVALLATEPSFVAFQCVLLIYLFPKVRRVWEQTVIVWVVLAALVFGRSLMVLLCVLSYSVFLLAFSRGVFVKVGVGILVFCAAFGGKLLISEFGTWSLFSRFMSVLSDVSFNIRWSYVENQFHVLIDTFGLGLGLGQYGEFWVPYYLKYIDYTSFDVYGEVSHALAGNAGYMKPWSVILGFGVDLGVVGISIIALFLYRVFKSCVGGHEKAIMLAGVVMITNSYPIVTPHVWVVFAMILAGRDMACKAPTMSEVGRGLVPSPGFRPGLA